MKYLILSLLLGGCGPELAEGPRPDGIDSMLDHFKEDAAKYGKDFHQEDYSFVIVDSLERNEELARCINGEQIQFVKEFWDHRAIHTKELILYHELGHCFLGRGHEDKGFSIMIVGADVLAPFWLIAAERAKLVEELFTGD